MRLDVFDPAICCSTGVCGPDVDAQLVQFAADAKWLANKGVTVHRVVTPMMRLRDPDHTRILIVTLPETTPVLEAEALQSDLRRADIEPCAWIVNQSLAASDTTDPLLRARAAAEVPLIERVQNRLAMRSAIVSLQAEAPVGPERLRALISSAPAHAEPSHV